jgi:hypothetical protein
MIKYYVNNFDNSETGVTPLHARFGSDAHKYLPIKPQIPITEFTNKYVKELDNNLQYLKNLSLKYQQALVAKRIATSDPKYQNRYVPGDYVLRIIPEKIHNNKLKPPKIGPWEVLYQRGNDVTVKHVTEHVIETFHVDEFFGFTETPEDAFNTAVLDRDQYILKCIHSYQGNLDKRTTIFFYTEWEDETILWKPWSDDVTNTQQF